MPSSMRNSKSVSRHSLEYEYIGTIIFRHRALIKTLFDYQFLNACVLMDLLDDALKVLSLITAPISIGG